MRRYCTLIEETVKEHRTPVDALIHLNNELKRRPEYAYGCYENESGFVDVRRYHVNGVLEVREIPRAGLLPAAHFPTGAAILSYIHARHADSESPLWSAGMIPSIITEVRDHFGTTRGLEHVLLKEYFAGDQKSMDQHLYAWDADLETTSHSPLMCHP